MLFAFGGLKTRGQPRYKQIIIAGKGFSFLYCIWACVMKRRIKGLALVVPDSYSCRKYIFIKLPGAVRQADFMGRGRFWYRGFCLEFYTV